MKKSKQPEVAHDSDESRKKALQFKKRKQRNKEPKINFKNIKFENVIKLKSKKCFFRKKKMH